jgi:hypothetical protein
MTTAIQNVRLMRVTGSGLNDIWLLSRDHTGPWCDGIGQLLHHIPGFLLIFVKKAGRQKKAIHEEGKKAP